MTYCDPQFSSSPLFLDGSASPGLCCLGSLSWTLWYLGYPEQAVQRNNMALTSAYDLGHPVSLGIALTFATALHMLRQEWQSLRERAEALWELAAQHGFAHQKSHSVTYSTTSTLWKRLTDSSSVLFYSHCTTLRAQSPDRVMPKR